MVQVRILEQPGNIRYRYKSERRVKPVEDDDDKNDRATAGITGVHSKPPDKKTHPSIMIEGYQGWATIRVSCVVDVVENGKYRAHPHELVGPDCKDGYFQQWLKITDDKHVKVFDRLSIRCVKKKDVREALELRRMNRVDPFKTGIAHARDPSSINLGALRLCFEVFIHDDGSLRQLPPLVSEVIFDTKKLSKLKISYCSHTSAPVTGAGNKIVLLCDKIFTKEINVVFFETGASGKIEWQTSARSEFIFQHVAVVVKVPPYKDPQSQLDHDVWIKLWDPSDDTRSTMSYPFRYTGIHTDPKYRPQGETELVTFSTRYGPIVTRKRAKRMYWIPPELLIPTTYNFQVAATEVPTTSPGSKISNQSSQKNPAIIDRFFSVPETDQKNRFFHRESSCPDSYVTRNSTITSISSTSQGPNMLTDIDVNIYQKRIHEGNSFVQSTTDSGAKTKAKGMLPTLSNSEALNFKCVLNENIDSYSAALPSNVDDQLTVPGTSSSQPLFPSPNTDLPHSSNEICRGLPSMDELMSHLRSVQKNEENILEDSFLEFVHSPNFPNFDDIL